MSTLSGIPHSCGQSPTFPICSQQVSSGNLLTFAHGALPALVGVIYREFSLHTGKAENLQGCFWCLPDPQLSSEHLIHRAGP